MKKFLFSVAAIVLTMCLALTACSKPATDSDVSGNGSSADVTSDVQSTISSENSDFSADNALSAGQSEASTESRISSEGGEQSADASASEDTSEIVAVVTPPNPDDTSDNVPDNGSSTADISVAPAPIDTPVNVTTDPTEDTTSEEHVHEYKYSFYESRSATCTKDGYAVYKCSCGDSYTEPSGKATGHAWTTWDIDAESMTATRTCIVSWCKQTETQDIIVIDNVDEFAEEACNYFIELLNEERAKLGAPALSTAPIAHEMAMVRANELTVLFSHQRPDGSNSSTVYIDYNYNPDRTGKIMYNGALTKCASPFSSSEDIMEGGFSCVNSAYDLALSCLNTFKSGADRTGHWADLTNPEYTGVGVGFVIGASGTFSTADINGNFSSYNPVHAKYVFELAVLTMDKTYG